MLSNTSYFIVVQQQIMGVIFSDKVNVILMLRY